MKNERIIENAASWVLRVGVFASVVTMVAGLILSYLHGSLVEGKIEDRRFVFAPGALFHELQAARGLAIIEIGILLLVLTPIIRVATSMILFALAEKDWAYTFITFGVLILTLSSLLFLH